MGMPTFLKGNILLNVVIQKMKRGNSFYRFDEENEKMQLLKWNTKYHCPCMRTDFRFELPAKFGVGMAKLGVPGI